MSLGGLSCVEVADIKTIQHDKARKINEYSRCTPEKFPNDLRCLTLYSRSIPEDQHGNRFYPGPKINKHVRAGARSLSPDVMFPGRVTVFPICRCYNVSDLAIGHHVSGRCKQGLTIRFIVFGVGGADVERGCGGNNIGPCRALSVGGSGYGVECMGASTTR